MTSMQKVLEGLQILLKYDETDGNFNADRDQIMCGGPRPEDLLVHDVPRLKELGWDWHREYACWYKFV